jgi:hypothetical protein
MPTLGGVLERNEEEGNGEGFYVFMEEIKKLGNEVKSSSKCGGE